MRPKPERHEQFVALLQNHRALLYRVSTMYGRSATERADLAQEIIANIWQAYARFDDRLKFSTWMYRIALNVAISWRRREATQSQHVVPDGQEILEKVAALESAAGPDTDLALLYQFIERFDEFDKALLMLYLDGLNHQEISAVLGITTTNIATKIGRLKERLRDNFRAAGYL
jgi:RNA polymerase sigma factor (sigma-70 family)